MMSLAVNTMAVLSLSYIVFLLGELVDIQVQTQIHSLS